MQSKQEIIDYYQNEINKVDSKLEKSALEYQCKQHLEAYEKGEEYKMENDQGGFECFGCGS